MILPKIKLTKQQEKLLASYKEGYAKGFNEGYKKGKRDMFNQLTKENNN